MPKHICMICFHKCMLAFTRGTPQSDVKTHKDLRILYIDKPQKCLKESKVNKGIHGMSISYRQSTREGTD